MDHIKITFDLELVDCNVRRNGVDFILGNKRFCIFLPPPQALGGGRKKKEETEKTSKQGR